LAESWTSYPKIYTLGHAQLKHLFDGPVTIQEKVDGSQFSFGRFGDELRFRSKGATVHPDNAGMFQAGVASITAIKDQLVDGWTYRGEYLQKPKHNTLAYDRVPKGHVILFDIARDLELYTPYEALAAEAKRLGLEVVPRLLVFAPHEEDIKGLLELTSVLGGQKIEGVVVKNYERFGPDGKPLMGKYVSEAFKEIHRGAWRTDNPTKNDIVEKIVAQYKTPARWSKAVQHLRERGELQDSPTDIGKLIKEVSIDVDTECRDDIKKALHKWAWPHISRQITHGMPEWYKEQLLAQQFKEVA
jgi:hypothetical protein